MNTRLPESCRSRMDNFGMSLKEKSGAGSQNLLVVEHDCYEGKRFTQSRQGRKELPCELRVLAPLRETSLIWWRLLQALRVQELNQVPHAAGVAPLVVVPG